MNYRLIAYAQDFVSFLLEKLKKDANKITKIILFGSVSRGDANEKSDIDLFFDVTDEKIEESIIEIKEEFYDSVKVKGYWKLLGIKNEFHCVIGKLDEWGLKASIIANGIILFGKYKDRIESESYYLFIVTPTKNRNKNISIWRELYGYTQKIGKKLYEKKGLVKEYTGEKLARGVFIIPLDHAQKIINYLKENKLNYKLIPFLKERAY